MKTDELREKYLEYFTAQGHHRQASDVLVPTWDPSVLFTPAGMNQFKDHFLGKVRLDFTRATTCQKCLRTGDIDNVGRTPYHHTFFEMLGNFSFGDYFKREAIRWAWEFLTNPRWLGIDPGRLSVTVYKDDDEAAKIWHEEIGLPTSRIARMEEDENFWPASAPSQGPDGVCGPCSEIYFQRDNGTSVEIWNLVFTQFNRVGDPPNNLRPLPSKNIDTGMGLERTAGVLQGVPSNFHIDILMPIVQAAAKACGVKYQLDSDDGRRLRRITDHVRASTFAVHENVYPGPNGAKYVVRRLIRRAVLDGHQMGMREPFLYQLVPAVVNAMAAPYPELKETVDRVSGVIRKEEEAFLGTIDAGLSRIRQMFDTLRREHRGMVEGEKAAELYQTYGVPPELLQTLAAEENFTFDWQGFRAAMDEHGRRSGGEQRELFQTGPLETLKEAIRDTPFTGYETTTADAVVRGIITGSGQGDDDVGSLLSHMQAGDAPLRIVLDQSPFYAESGGQVGDTGRIVSPDAEFVVSDTQKHGGLIVHCGRLVSGKLREGAAVRAEVDVARRDAIRRAHSATHLLHHALQENIGRHAQQQGSKVEADWLRFDFTNQEGVSDDVLLKIEQQVDRRIKEAAPVGWQLVSLAEARQAGAMMLFGEKYPDPVRMVSMGQFSRELCGGTHVARTDEVGAFELLSEESVSAGTRRMVALTGPRAREHRQRVEETVAAVAKLLGCAAERAPEEAALLLQEVRALKKQIAAGKATAAPQAAPPPASKLVPAAGYADTRRVLRDVARQLAVGLFDVVPRLQTLVAERQRLQEELQQLSAAGSMPIETLLSEMESIGDSAVLIKVLENANPQIMRNWVEQLKKSAGRPAAILLATAPDADKVVLIAGVSPELVKRGLQAGQWVGTVAKRLGGSGGGRPDLAQAGGKDPTQLPQALEEARRVVADLLGR